MSRPPKPVRYEKKPMGERATAPKDGLGGRAGRGVYRSALPGKPLQAARQDAPNSASTSSSQASCASRMRRARRRLMPSGRLAVRQPGSQLLRAVQPRVAGGDLLAQPAQALEHGLRIGELGAEQAHGRLVLDARERGGRAEPLRERLAPRVRQAVDGAVVRAAGRARGARAARAPRAASARRSTGSATTSSRPSAPWRIIRTRSCGPAPPSPTRTRITYEKGVRLAVLTKLRFGCIKLRTGAYPIARSVTRDPHLVHRTTSPRCSPRATTRCSRCAPRRRPAAAARPRRRGRGLLRPRGRGDGVGGRGVPRARPRRSSRSARRACRTPTA